MKPISMSIPHGTSLCRVDLMIPADARDCRQVTAAGHLVCGDDRSQALEWVRTSCHSGFGYGLGPGATTLTIGFGHTQDVALNQLEEAQEQLLDRK